MHEDGEGIGGLGARVRRHESAAHGLEVLVERQQGLLAQGQSLDLPLLHTFSFRWAFRPWTPQLTPIAFIAFLVLRLLESVTNYNTNGYKDERCINSNFAAISPLILSFCRLDEIRRANNAASLGS